MNLNKIISKAGSSIVTVTVFLFALFLIINFPAGYYFVCLILPIGFIMMTAGLQNECEGDRKVAANIGLILAAVYATFAMLVYFAQLTTVKNELLNEQAANLLVFGKFGIIFNSFIDRVTPWCNTHEPHAAIKQGKRGYAIARIQGTS